MEESFMKICRKVFQTVYVGGSYEHVKELIKKLQL